MTWDNDLLDLMKEGNADGKALKSLAPDLTILTPLEMMRILRATQAAHAQAQPPGPSAEPNGDLLGEIRLG